MPDAEKLGGTGGLPRRWSAALFHPWTWRMAWRDSRSQRGRLAIFALSIIAGVAALVALHSLKATVQSGVASQAKALLGSDLQISARHAFPAEAVEALRVRAKRLSRQVSFSSMLVFPKSGGTRLVQVRGVEDGYPFYGRIETEPAQAWEQLHAGPGVVVEPALLDQFQVRVGDVVKLGAVELPILGTVRKVGPRSARFGGFAPEVYVRLEDTERSALLGTSSLATYALHLELGGPVGERAVEAIRKEFADPARKFETPEDRRESLGDALDNFQQFLGLIALAALVLGAIGVAGAVHAQVSRRVRVVAVLRCLGCPGEAAFAVYLVQAMVLGALGAAAGALLGVGLHGLVLVLFRDDLPVAVDAMPVWPVVLQTAAAGFAVCAGFALLPLLRVLGVSPGAALRDGAEGDGGARASRAWPVYAALGGLLFVLTAANGSHWGRAAALTGGLAAVFALLAATARGLVWAARPAVRPGWPYLLRQGVSNLHRPHNQTLLFLLSLGLGTFLVVTILLVRNQLLERVGVGRFAESPNLYLVDVQADQLAGVEALLAGRGLPELESAPIITMRLTAVGGVPVQDLEKQGRVPKWVLQREYRSSYRGGLNSTEKIVAGTWWAGNAGGNRGEGGEVVPVSLEEDIAKDLRVGVGDEIALDVQGVPLRARVASLRKVDWSRFNLNFFMVFPPGVLEGAPAFHVLTTRTPPGQSSGGLQRALVEQFPNVSAIDLGLILETVRSILEKIGRVISVLAGFAVLAALPILAGTLLNGQDQRRRESVLLRTLGASARQVRLILLVEYASLGALSGLTGAGLAVAANAALGVFVFKASPWPDLTLVAVAFVCATGLALAGGAFISRGVCRHSPLEILRGNF